MSLYLPPSPESKLEWTREPDIEGVMVAQAREDGPTVVVMAAVHPNETSGIELVYNLPQVLDFKRGKVISILANIEAMKTQTRQADVNMNRSFRRETLGEQRSNPKDLPYELRRTQEIMDLIEAAHPDAMLDIHEYEDPNGWQNIICDRESLPLAQAVGAKAIILGFERTEPGGSDGFGHERGLPVICYEVGAMGGAFQRSNVAYGSKVLQRFLNVEGLGDEQPEPLHTDPIIAETAGESVVVQTDQYRMLLDSPRWFDILPLGTPVGMDGEQVLTTDPNKWQAMMFAKPTTTRGREPYALVDIL